MAGRPRRRARARRLRALRSAAACLALASVLAAAGAAAADGERFAYSVGVVGPIDHLSQRGLERALADARRADASLVIVRLDTPGGSADATRAIVRAMIASPLPVVVYVAPRGASADSAGLFVTLAGDVAAMAPATHIGSARPVRVGPPALSEAEQRTERDLYRKFLNSSVAFARSLAEDHGRNADLAERMVRVADNATAREAHRRGLIDVLAPTEQALLRSLDGFRVTGRKARVLRTDDLPIRRVSLNSVDLDEQSADASSFLRSLLLVGGGALTLALVAIGLRRGARWRRRRKRMRRARARRSG